MTTPIVRTGIVTVARRALAGAAFAALLATAVAPALPVAAQEECDFECQGVLVAKPDFAVTDVIADDPNLDIVNKGVLDGVAVADLIDSDGDGLSDGDEALYGADPASPDTDGDALGDYDEVYVHGTFPWSYDTDGDELSDYGEVFAFITNPLSSDTDGDRLLDGEEVRKGTDPANPDTDGDGMIDGEDPNPFVA